MTDEQKAGIYEQFHKKVLSLINSKVCDYDLAEDLCSDVFLKVYEKLDTFDETKASLSTWIFTITRNTLTDHYRTRRVFEEVPETIDDGSSIEDDYCNEETLETLADALERLDERSRDIIIFRYYKGLTLKEVADKMDMSYSYCKALHSQALAKLKKFF